MRFHSDDDRQCFIKEDQAHKELIHFVGGKLESGVMVLDFMDRASQPMAAEGCRSSLCISV
jgi:hypothetical protein